jgi:hypothetical protein
MKDRKIQIGIMIGASSICLICSGLSAWILQSAEEDGTMSFSPVGGLLVILTIYCAVSISGAIGLFVGLFLIWKNQNLFKNRSPWLLTIAIILCFVIGMIFIIISINIIGFEDGGWFDLLSF